MRRRLLSPQWPQWLQLVLPETTNLHSPQPT